MFANRPGRCDATMKHHLCTRKDGHKGWHIASMFDGTVLTWTDDGEHEEW